MKKKQGYNARLDDSLGSKNGKKTQSMKDRRDESEGMEKSMGKRKFSGNKSSGQGSPAKMTSKQKEKENERLAKVRKAKAKSSYKVTSPNTEPKSAKKGSPAKMKKNSAMKMKKSPAKMNEGFDKLPKDVQDKITKKGSPAKMKGGKVTATLRKDMIDSKGNVTKGKTKPAKTKKISEAEFNSKETAQKAAKAKAQRAANDKSARESGYMYNYNSKQYEPTPNKEGERRRKASGATSAKDFREFQKSQKSSPMNMSRDLSYGGPVIDQEPRALSHMGASKVLKHMNGSKHSPLNMNGGPGKPGAKMAQGDTIRGFDKYKVGDMVSEDDFEAKFKLKGKNPKNYPQLSVQDYSNVKEDKKGKYVNKLND